MTVQYNRLLLNVQSMNPRLFRLMFMWKGSVYKMIWPELLIFCILYFTFSFSYHFCLNEQQKETFESIAKYCNEFSRKLPLSFVLGFFAATVIKRFWVQFGTIIWPVDVAFKVGALISGEDVGGRMLRRTIVRYVGATFIMALSTMCPCIRRRFPTREHMVAEGFLLPEEKIIMDNMNCRVNMYFVPIVWASLLLQRCSTENRINSTLATTTIIDELNKARGKCGFMTSIESTNVPLAYTQVVILAVLIFCASCLLGRYKFDSGDSTDFHFPVMTLLQFIFYMGWLKVSLGGLHALGDDDDDFEFNSLIDVFLQESYTVADTLHNQLPEMQIDKYWDIADVFIPYTKSSLKTLKPLYIGSVDENTFRQNPRIVHIPPKGAS